MAAIGVEVVIDATPDEIWEYVAPVERHVEWMSDAVEIRFHGDQRRGLGARFQCLTKFGPVHLTDQMEITRWEPLRAMGVRHGGIVTGEGSFRLDPVNAISTRFRWEEDLTFPWYLGGRAGGVVGRPLLVAVWRRNLRTLKHLVEDGPRAHRQV